MKKIIFVVVLFIASISPGRSQGSPKKDNIKSLFKLMHQDSLIIRTFDVMAESMVNNMSTVFKDSIYANAGVDGENLARKLTAMSIKKSKENALRLLNEDLVDIYDKYFTSEEINQFISFYKTQAGQKWINLTPSITKDIMVIMSSKYQQSLLTDIQEITQEIMQEPKTK